MEKTKYRYLPTPDQEKHLPQPLSHEPFAGINRCPSIITGTPREIDARRSASIQFSFHSASNPAIFATRTMSQGYVPWEGVVFLHRPQVCFH
ncbi:MAG: hypothetical protein NTZ39_09340 [Methanoregula sp.]|nr:hypothetical protein [Methanoregula sp.]